MLKVVSWSLLLWTPNSNKGNLTLIDLFSEGTMRAERKNVVAGETKFAERVTGPAEKERVYKTISPYEICGGARAQGVKPSRYL